MKSCFTYVSLALLVLGCSAGDNPTPNYDVGVPPKLDTVVPTDNWNCTAAFAAARPKLTSPPAFTSQNPQPFRGTAPTGSIKVVVTGGPANQEANVGPTGTFCVMVSLTTNGNTSLYFQGVDALGCFSAKTSHTVQHTGKTKADAGITNPVNLAYKKSTYGDAPSKGYLKNLNDGDAKTSAHFSFWDWGNSCNHVRVDLGETYQINKFKLRWDQWADKKYATEYKILISKSSSPGAPACSGGGNWTMVLDKKGEDSTTKDLLISPKDARWAALLLYEDAAGGITSVYEDFLLAEFEVWGQTSGASTPPPPDKCP